MRAMIRKHYLSRRHAACILIFKCAMASPISSAPVWEALSERFVGKELQDYDYAGMPKHCADPVTHSTNSKRYFVKKSHRFLAAIFLRSPYPKWKAQDTVVKEIQTYLERGGTDLSRLLTRLVTSRTLPDVATKR